MFDFLDLFGGLLQRGGDRHERNGGIIAFVFFAVLFGLGFVYMFFQGK